MPNMNRRNTTDFAMPATGTLTKAPIKMPARSDPVAPPRLNPRNFRFPTQ
jgi:hypothetical protein